MKVNIVNKSKYPLPKYQTEGAVAVDLIADIDQGISLKFMERTLVPTGIYIQVPDGYVAQITPRSGLAYNHGLSIVNSPGLIDQDYRGEVGVLLINFSRKPYKVIPGERIAQMSFVRVDEAEWVEVEELKKDSLRSQKGFGSTGSKSC